MSNVERTINNQTFQWDSDKAELNRRKHDITFDTAALVFADENRLERFDDVHSRQPRKKGAIIMLVTKVIDLNAPLTPEQKEELRALKDRPIVFDEDCPPQTEEQLKKFKRVNPRRKEQAAS